MNVAVPDEISIMGYDDQELARYTHPPLSTLVLPNFETGQYAAELLFDLAIVGKNIKPQTIKIDGPLVKRETTTTPRKTCDVKCKDFETD